MTSRFVASALLAVLALAPAAAQEPADEVLLGTVRNGSVFAVPRVESERPLINPPVTLLQAPLRVDGDKPYTVTRYEFHQYVLVGKPYRWRIVRDLYWGAGSQGAQRLSGELKRIPVAELPFFNLANPLRQKQYVAKYPRDPKGLVTHSWSLGPMSTIAQHRPLPPGYRDDATIYIPPPPIDGVVFDAYPVADDRVLLFVLEDDLMRTFSGTAKEGKFHDWIMDWGKDEKEIERFQCPFQETFTVFVRGPDYYFVSESGSLYLARKPAQGERKVAKIWDDRRQPIRALLTDASNDKVFAFVEPRYTDRQDEERVYFELAAKPEPTRYRLKKLEGVQIDEPLKSVLEFAHVLRDDKRLK